MKYFRLLNIVFLTLFTSFFVSAQNKQDILYLKNGSIIKGEILELEFNKSVKIKTTDGSIFVFEYDKVQKIEKTAINSSISNETSSPDAFDGEMQSISTHFSDLIKSKRRDLSYISTQKVNGVSKIINGQKIREIDFLLTITPKINIFITSDNTVNNNGILNDLGYILNKPTGWGAYTHSPAIEVATSQKILVWGVATFDFTDNGWRFKTYKLTKFKLAENNNLSSSPPITKKEKPVVVENQSSQTSETPQKEDTQRKELLINQLRYNYSFVNKENHVGFILQNGPHNSKIFLEIMVDKDKSFDGTEVSFERCKKSFLDKIILEKFTKIPDSLSHVLYYININKVKTVNDNFVISAEEIIYQIANKVEGSNFHTKLNKHDEMSSADMLVHHINQFIKESLLFSLPVINPKFNKNNILEEIQINIGKNLFYSAVYKNFIIGNSKQSDNSYLNLLLQSDKNLRQKIVKCTYNAETGILSCQPESLKIAEKLNKYIDLKSKLYLYGF